MGLEPMTEVHQRNAVAEAAKLAAELPRLLKEAKARGDRVRSLYYIRKEWNVYHDVVAAELLRRCAALGVVASLTKGEAVGLDLESRPCTGMYGIVTVEIL